MGKEEFFGDILVPAEKVVELVKGKRRTSSRKFFPGYILVNMALNDDTWHVVKSTPKVTGFVGGADRSVPSISETEVRQIAQQVRRGRGQAEAQGVLRDRRERQGRRRAVPGLQRRRRGSEARERASSGCSSASSAGPRPSSSTSSRSRKRRGRESHGQEGRC